MPAPDPTLPESIVVGQFEGVRNTSARHRLKPEELEQALNVDIDDRGQARRRRGYTERALGDFHSLKTIGGRTYGVKDGVLGWIDTQFGFHSFSFDVGPQPLSYAVAGTEIFFSSTTVAGRIVDGAVLPWGADVEGVWLSPVITPTDTLGELFGKQLAAPPRAAEIGYYKGRIYLGAGRYLWATELWLYDYLDRTRNFLQFEEDLTMIAPMDDGIYVGTEQNLWFLSGTLADGLKRSNVLECGVVRGSAVSVPGTDIHPNARNAPMGETMGVAFMTTRGFCAGFDSGQVYDLTHGRVEFPNAQSAAVLHREDSGVSSYVAVTDSAGGPTTNARIGDYVDAEIVRRGG